MAARSVQPMRSLEIFTGAGGMALATHDAGFRHVGLVEWNEDACATVRANVAARRLPGIENWQVHQADVRQVKFSEMGAVDLVAGGPPCQPFSIGGKHRGMDDDRDMIPQFIRAVRETTPKAFIMENVKGLTRESFRTYFEYCILQLALPDVTRKRGEDVASHLGRLEDIHTRGRHSGLKYNVLFRVLNAADYGVPQTRQRVFVVGFRADLGCEWHFPEPTHSLDALLSSQWVTGDYWSKHSISKPKAPPRFAARVRALTQQQLPLIKTAPWMTLRDAIFDLPTPRLDRESKTFANHRLQPGARRYAGHTGSWIDLPSKTLKAGDHGVPGGENTVAFSDGSLRYLTVREAARVQTFPDGWSFSGAWSEAMRQLGNAVPVRLANVVAQSVGAKLVALNEQRK